MKPQPQQEIRVVQAGDLRILLIFAQSNDVRVWIDEVAPEFGVYFTWNHCGEPAAHQQNHAVLQVSPLYDFQEVQRYLQSQGKA